MSDLKEDDGNLNKKRQELSDQLKQISIKIDQEILELRKQNNNLATNSVVSTSTNKKRESLGPTIQSIQVSSTTNRTKTQDSFGFVNISTSNGSKDALNQSKDHYGNTRERISSSYKDTSQKLTAPKVHLGPFNTQCIFM